MFIDLDYYKRCSTKTHQFHRSEYQFRSAQVVNSSDERFGGAFGVAHRMALLGARHPLHLATRMSRLHAVPHFSLMVHLRMQSTFDTLLFSWELGGAWCSFSFGTQLPRETLIDWPMQSHLHDHQSNNRRTIQRRILGTRRYWFSKNSHTRNFPEAIQIEISNDCNGC